MALRIYMINYLILRSILHEAKFFLQPFDLFHPPIDKATDTSHTSCLSFFNRLNGEMSNYIIELKNISKEYAGHHVLEHIDLSIRDGEFLTLLGPSGCGKTTLLRLISGFEQPDEGKIFIAGKEVSNLPPEMRDVRTVFQSYALFPHMTVFDNVAFGLRCKRIAEKEITERVKSILSTVKLERFAQRKPEQLSGGQQQRVAIARAVVNKPIVLLLDEPLSALDYRLRKAMQIELKQLQRQLGITFVFVTHDQEEALSMSDRIAVLHEGCIEQLGTPREVYEKPRNITVAKFIGELNIFDTFVTTTEGHLLTIMLESKEIELKLLNHSFKPHDKIQMLIRPEDLRVWHTSEIDDTEQMLAGKVEEVIYKGSTVDLMIRLDSGKLLAATEFFDEDEGDIVYKLGEHVWISWPLGWETLLPVSAADET